MGRRATWQFGAAIAAVLVYAVMWLGFRAQWAWLHWLDVDAVAPMRGYASTHRGWVVFWNIVCTVFSPTSFQLIGLAVVVLAALRRKVRTALFVLACIGLSGVWSATAKALADRSRPTGAMVYAHSSSFPSGHAVAVMAGVLVLLTVTRGVLGRARPWVMLLGAIVVLAVGFGRVALDVHYPSDVLAGWALGWLWFVVCLAVFRPRPVGSGLNTASAR